MTEGSRLASGYVDLSVKWQSAAKGITNEFLGLQKAADRAGDRAGASFTDQFTGHLDEAGKALKSELTGTERIADRSGRSSGSKWVNGLTAGASRAGDELTANLLGVQNDATRIGRNTGDRYARGFNAEASKARIRLPDAAQAGSAAGEDAGGGFTSGFGLGVAGLVGKGGPVFAAISAAALAAGKIIGPQIAASMEAEAGRDLVQARLGLDEKSMANIAKSAAAAFGQNWGESVSANMDTAAVAIQAGLLKASDDGGAQAKLIGQLTAVSTLLGEDIPSVVRSASQAIRTGIAKDATGAFDLLVVAQQNGLNISGDLLDTVNEYGTQFRKLGLSGPEAFGLISQAVKNGARDTDVAADALKEFSIRAVDNSELTRDAYAKLGLDADLMREKFAAGGQSAKTAFTTVTDAIRGIKDPADQAEVAVALFGTQAEDLGAAMQSFDLSKAVDEFGAVEQASQAAADKMASNSANEWETAKRNILNKVAEIREALNMSNWFDSVPQALNEWLGPDQKLTPGAPGVPWQPGNAMQGGNAAAGQNPLEVFAPTGEQGSNGLFPAAEALKGRYSEWGFTGIGGYSPNVDQPWDEHQTGTAIDVPIPGGNSGAGISVVQDALRQPGTQHVIWQQKLWYPDGRVEDMEDRGSPTENHMDHVHIKTYDQGGWLPPGLTLANNETGKPEYILTPQDIENLKKQGIDPATMQHGQTQGALPGPTADMLKTLGIAPQQDQDMPAIGDVGRTGGYIPAAAGSTSVAGTSFLSSLYGMGAEVINGFIDQAASAAAGAAGAAATVFAPGSGGAASGLTSAAIGMGTQAAKRGVEYGAQMLGILTDSIIEQATPFGAPRILTTDPTGFMPQQLLSGAIGKMMQPGQPMPGMPGQGPQPGAPEQPHAGTGTAPGAPAGPMPGLSQGIGQATPPPNQQPPLDFLKPLGIYDNGGWLPPGGLAMNLTRSAEPMPVFNHDQWGNISAIANTPISEVDRSGGSVDNRMVFEAGAITVKDVAEFERAMRDRQSMQSMRYRGRPG